jgi:hypothetical protein
MKWFSFKKYKKGEEYYQWCEIVIGKMKERNIITIFATFNVDEIFRFGVNISELMGLSITLNIWKFGLIVNFLEKGYEEID